MMDELISDDNYEFTIILILFIHHGNSFKERINDESLYASLPNSDCMPEVSAVLLECPKQYRGRSYQDDPDSTHERNTCEPQLMVNIRVNPTFHIEQLEKFLILDEVYDPRKRTKAKILSPYLIELSRGEPIMMYPLQFSKTVKLENVNNKECDESGQHQNIGNHITTDKYMPAEPNTDNNDSDNESSKDDHGTNEEHCQHNFNHHTTTPKCDEIMESSEPPSTTCETSTVRSTTCMPLTTRPPNKCHNNHLSPEDESLNRVMQNIQKAFGPVTKIGRNRQSGRIKQNYYKGRTGDPTDFSNIFKKPHDQFENPYSNPKSDKYPNVWNKDRFMHRSFNKKTNDKIEVNSRIGPKKRKKLFQSRIFDDLSANVGVEQPFAKRLLGNKLAQLGVITSPRAVRKTYKKEKKEKEIDDVKDSFEDEDDDVSTFSKDFDYDDLLEKKIADIEGIERDELPPRASDTDEKEYRDTEERIDAILRNRKKVNENRKRFQARRKLHPYIDEKLAKIMAAKANLKSIGSKSASRREPEDENNGQMKLQSNEKYPNHQQFDEDDDLKEDSKVDMDESDLLSSVETQDAFDEKPYKKAQFYHEPKINDGKYRRMKFFRKQKKEKSFDNNEDSINFNVGKNMREEERTHNVFKRSPNVLRRPFSLNANIVYFCLFSLFPHGRMQPIIAGIPLDEPAPKKPVNREDEIDDDEELYYHLNGDHYRDLQGGYWPGKYGADQDKDKEITNDVNFQRLKTHNEELYQPILYGNYLKNPALMYNYQTEKSAMKTSTSSNEDETTESFVPDFMQPSKTEFENMYKCKGIKHKPSMVRSECFSQHVAAREKDVQRVHGDNIQTK
uniref:Uncharacterized protein n=1 Tax=Glossina brevipalpis TaxID=37001 RepID=A0A1A9W2R0_9MUSC